MHSDSTYNNKNRQLQSISFLFVCLFSPESLQSGWAPDSWIPRKEKNKQHNSAETWWEKEKQGAHSKLLFSVQEEPDLNKAPLSKLPFLKYEVLTSCMVHFVVSLNFLEPCWGWCNPHIWCQDRNTSGLLHYSCWEYQNEAHTSYSCYSHLINFVSDVCMLWIHIVCMMCDINYWNLFFFFFGSKVLGETEMKFMNIYFLSSVKMCCTILLSSPPFTTFEQPKE